MICEVASTRLDETQPGNPAHQADAQLLARAAAGDDRAFSELYQVHRHRVYRLAYGVLLDPDEARDAVQEAFLRLHIAAPDWQPRAAVSTWLYRVVLNHCLGLQTRLRRLVHIGRTRSDTHSPESRALLGEAVAIVEGSLRSLPTRQRAIACLFLEAELSPAEIATLVDLTPNATRVALHRSLTRLRDDLRAAGIEAPPTAYEAQIMMEDNDADAS